MSIKIPPKKFPHGSMQMGGSEEEISESFPQPQRRGWEQYATGPNEEKILGPRRQSNFLGGFGLVEHGCLLSVGQDAVLQVEANGAGQDDSLEVAAFADQILDGIAVADADHVLF